MTGTEEYVIPEPEPKEIDEKLSMELRHFSERCRVEGPSLR